MYKALEEAVYSRGGRLIHLLLSFPRVVEAAMPSLRKENGMLNTFIHCGYRYEKLEFDYKAICGVEASQVISEDHFWDEC